MNAKKKTVTTLEKRKPKGGSAKAIPQEQGTERSAWQAEDALKDSETRYRRLFEAAQDGILILNAETGQVEDVNPYLETMLGYSHEVFLGKKLWEIGAFKDIAASKKAFKELQAKKYIRYEDLPLETSDGRSIRVEFISNVYLVDHTKVIQCNVRNITERAQAVQALRESEEKFKRLFEDANVGKAITQFSGGIQVNRAFADWLGYSQEELQNKKWQDITHPEDIALTQREIDRLLSREKEAVRLIKRYLRKDGSVVWGDLSSSVLIDPQGKPLYMMTTIVDITERKQAEEALRESEQHFRSIVAESEAGYFFIDKDGIIRDVNATWVKLYRYQSAEEIIGQHFAVIQKIDDLEQAKEFVDGILRGDARYLTGEFSRQCKDGTTGWHTFSARPVARAGETTGIEGFIIDTTEKRRSAEQVLESEAHFHSLFDTMTEGVALHTVVFDETGAAVNYRIEDVNPQFEHILGLHKTDIAGKLATEAYGVSDPPYGEMYFRAALQHEPGFFESYFPPMQKHFLISVTPWGKEGFATVFQDITARKQVEEALRESEEKWRSLVSASPDFIALLDSQAHYLFMNHYAEGFSEKEVVGTSVDKYLSPESVELYHGYFEKALSTWTTQHFEMAALGDNNSRKMYDQYLIPQHGKEQETYILAIARDITERREAEEGLRENEARYHLVFENSGTANTLFDAECRVILQNSLSQKLTMPMDAIGKTALEVFGPEQGPVVTKRMRRVLASGKPEDFETEFTMPAGTRWMHSSYQPLHDEQQHVTGIQVISQDITERKRTEEALRESEDKFKYMFDHSSAGRSITGLNGELDVNQAFCDMLGYSMEELKGRNWQELTHPEDVQLTLDANKELISGVKESIRITKRFIHKNGSIIWADVSSALRRDQNGKPLYFMSTFLDITARKQAEEKLQQERILLRTLIDNLPDRIYAMDVQGRKTLSNNADWQASGGKSMEDVIGKTDLETYPPELAEQYWALDKQVIDSGKPIFNREEPGLDPSGKRVWVLSSKVPLSDAQGNTIGLVGVGRDISDRKKAEEELSASQQLLKKTLSSLLDAVFIIDSDTVEIKDCNPAASTIFGYSRQEMLGKTTTFLHVDQASLEEFREKLDSGVEEKGFLFLPDYRMKRKDGTVFPTEHSVIPILDEQDKRTGWVSVVRDITARKQTEEALQQSEEKFRNIVELSPIPYAFNDENENITYLNTAFTRTFGYGLKDIPTLSEWWPRAYPDPEYRRWVAETWQANLDRAKAERAGFEPMEVNIQCKDGSIRTCLVAAGSLTQAFQGVFLVTFIDITELKQEQTLQEAVYQIATAAETASSLEELYPQIHQAISAVMPAENFYITLYDEAQDTLRFPYFKDVQDEPYIEGIHPARGLTAYVLRTGKSLLCTQAVHDELERQGEVRLLGEPSAIWLGAPLVVEGKVIGAMVVQHYSDPKAYGEREQHILEFVSHQVAIAISRKQAEEALREGEEKFRLSFMTGLDAIYIATLEEGLIIEANDNFESVFGYTRAEAIGKTSLGLNLYYDPSDRLKMVWELKARGFIRDLELKGRKKSGEIITVSISISVIQIKNKAHILGVIRDITERKQAQITSEAVYKVATAAETTGSLEELYPQIHQIISAVMPAENFYITLYDEAENMLRFVYFKDAADESFKDGILTGQGLTGYLMRSEKSLLCTPALLTELERKEGFKMLGVPFAIWLGVPLLAEGKVIGAMVVQDYSDPKAYGEREQHMLEFVSGQVAIAISRKRAEKALRESEERFRSLYENATIGIYRALPDGRIILANPAMVRMLGYQTFAEIFERDLRTDGYEPEYSRLEFQQRVEQEVGIHGLESAFKRKDGATIYVRESAHLVMDERGQPLYYEGTVEDITERKQAEDKIRELNATLEQRVEERTRQLEDAQEKLVRNEKLAVLGQLAGGVGHELRNPLGVINTSIYYLKMVQPDATEKVKRHHDIIEQEVRNADKIISDLLDFARIKSVEQEPVSVKELVQRTLVRFPPPPQVQVTLDLPASLPEVYADPRQMEQVLGNLVTNGCQSMKDGGQLTVRGEKVTEEKKKQMARISVKDTGTGITPENMKNLFEPLFTTKAKGIGLGLAVSKKLAEANGGRIEVESEVGKGSTFTLVLPAVQKVE